MCPGGLSEKESNLLIPHPATRKSPRHRFVATIPSAAFALHGLTATPAMMPSFSSHPFVCDDDDDDGEETLSNLTAAATITETVEPSFSNLPPSILRNDRCVPVSPTQLAPSGTTVYSSPHAITTAIVSDNGETIEFRREKMQPPQQVANRPEASDKASSQNTGFRSKAKSHYPDLAELNDRIAFVPECDWSDPMADQLLHPTPGKEVVSEIESAAPLMRACDYPFANDLPTLATRKHNPYALSFMDRSFVNCVRDHPEQPIPGAIRDGNALETVHATNQSPAVLGVENYPLFDFLRDCSGRGKKLATVKGRPRPELEQVIRQEHVKVTDVRSADLLGDQCDFQGLDWTSMRTERDVCRKRRLETYQNYVNRLGSDQWSPFGPDADMSANESFFRFKRMAIRGDVKLAHFQLRSVLACPSRAHAYFPGPRGIYHFNTALRKTQQFLNVRDIAANDDVVSTLDARHGVMVCGLFNGDYLIKSLDSTDPEYVTRCRVSKSSNGITNHVRIFQGRSSSRPLAAMAGNGKALRLFDVGSQALVRRTQFPFAINCTAVSPDKRRRAVVGDDFNLLITEEETGKVVQKLPGHRDYVFSCDWADDGWHVATGSQDMAVRIWDARRWTDNSGNSLPLCTFKTDMAGPRSLRFSPAGGGGAPVLVAAEEADIIHVIETRKLKSRQKLDVFAEIAGIDFTDEGRGLNVLCCDPHRGGLLELERCGGGAALLHNPDKTWQKWNNLADYDMPIGV